MTALASYQPAPRLLQIKEAAELLGVPAASLRSAADYHGLTIRMGRAVRISPTDLPELIDLCRADPKERASSKESAKVESQSGSSEMANSNAQRAQAIANRLKSNSPITSPKNTAEVLPLTRKK